MRITRGAAAKEAALGLLENIPVQVENPAATPVKRIAKSTTRASKGSKKATAAKPTSAGGAAKIATAGPASAKAPPSTRKSREAKDDDTVQGKSENKERVASRAESPKVTNKTELPGSTEELNVPSKSAAKSKKRKRTTAPKPEEDPNELPHGLGKLWEPSEGHRQEVDKQADADVAVKPEGPSATVAGSTVDATDATVPVVSTPATKKRARGKATVEIGEATIPVLPAPDTKAGSSTKKSPKKQTNPYGLTPGVTPFPDWPHPTREECEQVNELLSSLHGKVTPPAKIPPPSETVAGCGEVPSVLDALIRTYLSAATSGTNSSRAFQGLIDEYGKQTSGIGRGSVNWDAVRRSPVERVFKAIKSGGLADVKSKRIKTILDMVYEENQARGEALSKAHQEKDKALLPKGAEEEGQAGQAAEIARAEQDVLSLDHLHAMSDTDVFNHLLRYPGIGVKTSSCVSLFCLRRPSFAVDTHVFRLCQWLGWVPKTADRDKTFMHCEVRVPNELKYSLHQLLIMHGKKCPRCRAITGESSEGWNKGCVIDHLVTRTGVRKGGESPVKKHQGAKKRKQDESEGDGDFEASPTKTPKTKKLAKTTPRKTSSKETASGKKGTSKGEAKKMKRDGSDGEGDDGFETSPIKMPEAKRLAKTTPKKTPIKKAAGGKKKEAISPIQNTTNIDTGIATPKPRKSRRQSAANASADKTA
ncbi:MAG: hypothetical protein L6R39_006189 [Caloplaca ligustica]|nr:MAG: hypothetical protein L6R39_006189 [Caloplaca ligustica]